MNKPLDKQSRNKLEHTVVEARGITESAARAALEQLGMSEAMPFAHLTEEERRLRRKLRVHGRQLGDIRNSKGAQQIDRLIDEVAYEHWHRMLFARFLAENNLLMYPDPEDPVAVTLEECEDLASQEGAQNGWELAARFATHMLPQIFRPDSPVFQLVLPPEHQQKLERLVANLPQVVFNASDSLGWVYQFWQTKKKAEVNASEVKIGARELPAVTQLFTEPYMVSFLLDNSIGAWWVARRLSKVDLNSAASEEELRAKAALPGMSLKYLRFVKEDDGSWTPAAGTFDGWPEHLSEFKVLDPCCGSGHFLVAAFLMLVPIRIELGGLSACDAVEAVLSENIQGLELDQRCVELAAFSLALTAWRYPKAGGYRPIPELNIACSGLAISAKKEDWLALAGDNNNLSIALGELYKQFKDAPVFGSLINPEIGLAKGSIFELKWEEVGSLLTKALCGEKNNEETEMGVVAQGITKAAELLSNNYSLVITNVPYLKSGYQSSILKKFCENNYKRAKYDLATVFVERIQQFLREHGIACLVSSQYWLFLKYYEKMRKNFISNETILLLAKLGAGAFETISGEVVNVCLQVIEKKRPNSDSTITGIEIGSDKHPEEKSSILRTGSFRQTSQQKQLLNPDARISFELEGSSNVKLLSEHAYSKTGLQTGDNDKYSFRFWELIRTEYPWVLFQRTAEVTSIYKGLYQVLRWEDNGEKLKSQAGSAIRGLDCCGKNGILVNRMSKLPVTIYTGEIFDQNGAVLVPLNNKNIEAIWCYVSSQNYQTNVRKLDKKIGVTPATLAKVPFDLDHWTKVAQEKYPNGLPKPYTEDPTQWLFHGHPAQSNEPLQVAVVRLLGYRWPAELDSALELSPEARAWIKKSETLLSMVDKDGIFCIPPVRGEASGADRLLNLLATAYGDDWNNNKLTQLLKQANHAGKTLETWLRDKFFTQHCKLFHHRPFIWHIWDGMRDGFAALVNCHKLDAKLLETLIYTYLGDWISRQKQGKANGVDGVEEKLVAAEILKKSLELILEGEAPYDIFVRWKLIEKQPIGWNPDPNDGVRLNIRPFLAVPDVGRKGAGVLRDKPNINWNKDRGKDVESAPWYHLGLQYGGREGDRINDHHLSLAGKRAAREAKKMETR